MNNPILKLGLAAALITAALPASPALAGRYHVYSCRTPVGAPAPADGWSGANTGTFTYVVNSCAEAGGSLVAALGDEPVRVANTGSASWTLAVPSAESLAGATLWRAGDAAGGAKVDASYEFSIAGLTEGNVVDRCVFELGCAGEGEIGTPFAASNRLVLDTTKPGPGIFVRAACGGEAGFECPAGKGDTSGYAAVVDLYAADLTLEQTAGPTVSGVGGELASAASLAGTSDLTFNAADPGAGVYEAVFSVDGKVVQQTVIDEESGRCHNVGETSDGLPAFLYLQPCPASVSADVAFDTTGISDGSHHLTVMVSDAAGNLAPALDRTVTVANPVVPGPANGQGSAGVPHLEARWKSTPKVLLTGAYGKVRTITGRLLSETGTAISGAQIEASYSPSYGGSKATALAGLRTGLDGRFTLRLPTKASSESVALVYRAHLGDATPAAMRTLMLAVHAPVLLSVSPHVSGVGRRIYFHGRLVGGPFPKGGKPLILEARAGRSGWIEFNVLRSDSHGRFHARYRFKFAGPVHYQFRVVCEHEADYPYAFGASPVVRVYER